MSIRRAGGPVAGPMTPSAVKPAPAPRKRGYIPRAASARAPAALTAAAASAKPRLDVNGAYLPDALKLISGAKKSIDLVQYNFFSESGEGKQLVDALIAKKKANPRLEVKVFIEGDHGDAAARNLATVALLEAGGVDVVLDSKNLVTHAKAICVDGRSVLAGSHNLSNTSMTKNNEVSLGLDSPKLAAAWRSYFAALERDPANLHPTTTKAGSVTMLTDTACFDQLIDVVKTAKKSLDASMYYFNFKPGDPKATQLMDELVKAQQRGVHVRLFLEQSSANFAPTITAANKQAYAYLKAHGVADVHFDSPTQISHQKFIVKDGAEVLMGSSNWSTDDFDKRHQINWRLQDKALAGQLVDLLTKEIADDGAPPI